MLDDYKAQQEVLDKMLIDANKLSDKDGKRTQAVNDTKKAMADLNYEIEKVGNENKVIEVDVKINDEKQKQEFEKLKREGENLQIEGKVKLGLMSESEKLSVEITNIKTDKTALQKEIDKINTQIASGGANQQLTNQIKDFQNQIDKLDFDLITKQKDYLDKTERDRISSISN